MQRKYTSRFLLPWLRLLQRLRLPQHPKQQQQLLHTEEGRRRGWGMGRGKRGRGGGGGGKRRMRLMDVAEQRNLRIENQKMQNLEIQKWTQNAGMYSTCIECGCARKPSGC